MLNTTCLIRMEYNCVYNERYLTAFIEVVI